MSRKTRFFVTCALLAMAASLPALALAQPGAAPAPPAADGGAAPADGGAAAPTAPAETAAPMEDAATPAQDAAAPEQDAAPPEQDAAPLEADAGVQVGIGGLPEESKDTGVEIGVRIGAATPFGKILDTANGDGKALNEAVPVQFPLWLDLGYRIVPNFYVGVYGQFGLPVIKDCTDCTGYDVRFGLNAHYHVLPKEKIDPWIGLGVMGYEIMHLSQSLNGNDTTLTASGFEFVNVQGGADFKLGKLLKVGPFLSFSVDQAQDVTYDNGNASLNAFDLPGIQKAVHMWLLGGVKASIIP